MSARLAPHLRMAGRPRADRVHPGAVVGARHVRGRAAVCCRRRWPCSRGSSSCSATTYLQNVAITLFRLFSGFGIAVAMGVRSASPPRSRTVERPQAAGARAGAAAEDRALPGPGADARVRNSSKIALVVADAVFPIVLATYHGMRAVEPKLAWVAQASARSGALHLHGGAARRTAVGADRLPYRADHFLHRRVSRRDDHVDRRSRASAGARGGSFQTVHTSVR